MKDWLGQEFSVGDLVIYGAGSGRSITMVLGRVTKFNAGSVGVQPLRSSRWPPPRRTRWIDNRTGKGIDPYATEKHTEVPAHYVHKVTGKTITAEERYVLDRWERREYEYIPPVFKDYAEEVITPVQPVTISVTKNITKWNGELPPEEE